MHVTRTVWFGAGSIAVATWLAAATTSGIRTPALPTAREPESPLERSMSGLQHDVERLHQRIAPSATPLSHRDLFRFQVPAPRRSPAAPIDQQAPLAPPPAGADRAAALTLIGVAEDAAPEGITRTAVVSAFGDVLLLKPGDTIGDRFRVLNITAQSVEVQDLGPSGSTITLTLR